MTLLLSGGQMSLHHSDADTTGTESKSQHYAEWQKSPLLAYGSLRPHLFSAEQLFHDIVLRQTTIRYKTGWHTCVEANHVVSQ